MLVDPAQRQGACRVKEIHEDSLAADLAAQA